MPSAALCAALCVVGALLLVFLLARARRGRRGEAFYTEYALEEPTRSWLPYTGSVPDPARWRAELTFPTGCPRGPARPWGSVLFGRRWPSEVPVA